jgi:WD40 repeat protein
VLDVPADARLLEVAVAPDGRRLATVGADRAIRVHDAATGKVLATRAWHEGRVWGVVWAGETLVTGDAERVLALWDVPAS